MSSSADAEKPSRFSELFSDQLVITVPSHPSVRYLRATPSHYDLWSPIVTNPENSEFTDTKGKLWDQAAVDDWRHQLEERYAKANIEHHALEVLVELDHRVVGYGGLYMVGNGVGSIGVILNKEGRGMGLGKLTVGVLAQLCFDYGIQPGAGTMKANKPMRAVMANLGAAEKEAIVDLPGRGIVAELGYTIEREKWKDVDIKIGFEEASAGK